jgi:glutamyl-tRNA reductase
MLGKYRILTITHRETTLDNLSHFVIKSEYPDEMQQQLLQLKQSFGLDELMYLATCNRVMFLFHSEENISTDFIHRFFKMVNPNMPDAIRSTLPEIVSQYIGQDAIGHLFGVAASTDSMVIGEREILRQLRQAYEQCLDWQLTGDFIRLAMRFAVEAAKGVYANTRIGEKSISVASLAIQQMLKGGLPKNARVLMIGAGQTNTLVTKFLHKHQLNNLTVFNRTLEKAQNLAKLVGGKALPYEELFSYDEGFDALIVCTGATDPIVDKELYQQLLNNESDHKVLVDLSVPNNIDRQVVEAFSDTITYIEIESLRAIAQQNLSFREQEVTRAQIIIDKSLLTFQQAYQQRQIEKAMRHVPEAIKAIKSHAMNKVFRKELEGLDDNTLELMKRMMSYMEKRCISIPMKAAKEIVPS